MKMENSYIIKGNKETYINNFANDNQENWTHNQIGGLYQTFRELSPDAYDFLTGLDEERYIKLSPNLNIYAVHAPKFVKPSPKYKTGSSNFHRKMLENPFTHEQFLSEFHDLVNSDDNKAVINQIDANVILFGHNHLQSYAYCGDKLIINPGSCGQPLDFDSAAAYTILEEAGGGFSIFEKRVEYNIDYVINQTKKSLLYEKGKMWTDLVCLAIKTGRDYFGFFFEIARDIASSKNETGMFFSNPTWEEASEIFISKYKSIMI